MKYTVFFVILLLFFFGCNEPEENGQQPQQQDLTPKAEWTLMVYLDADNDLEQASITDVDEMEKIGSNEKINIVLQWDRITGFDESNGDWTTTKRFLVKKDEQEGIIASKELMDLGELNMAKAETLAEFIEWAKQNFPAEKYALILWDHGGGWIMHTEDKTSESQANLQTLRDAFNKAGLKEKKLDLIVFDQCLMSQIDVAYEMKDFAEIMVASEDVIPFFSMDYSDVLGKLNAKPEMNSKEFSEKIVESYADFYSNKTPDPFTTMSALNLTKINELTESLTEFTGILKNNAGEKWPEIGESIYFSESFATPEGLITVKALSVFDLIDFLEILKQKTSSKEIKDSAEKTEKAIKEIIIAEFHGSEHPYAKGLTVYFPKNEILYNQNYPENSLFARETEWNEFLKEYIKAEQTDLIAPTVIIDQVSSNTVNVNNPVTFYGTATGNNIISLYSVIGRVEGDNIFVLSNHPLTQAYTEYQGNRKIPEFFDGANNIDYTWMPTTTVLNNGQKMIIAPIQPFGKGDYYFSVQGELKQKTGEIFDALLVFDYRTGLLLNALQAIESDNGITQKEFLIQAGDVFTPYFEVYDLIKNELSLIQTDSITIGSNGLGLDIILLPEGQYTIGLFVSDISGNTAMNLSAVQVSNQPKPDDSITESNITGDWQGKELSFEIKENSECNSIIGTKQAECMYWFRNYGWPFINFLVKAENEVIFVSFLVDVTANKMILTELFEGKKYVLWRNGVIQEEPEIDSNLIREWFNTTGSIEFKANGNFAWKAKEKTITGSFSTENKKLTLITDGRKTIYSYSVSGENLTLTDTEENSIYFTKTKPQTITNPLIGSWFNAAVNETVYFNADNSYQSYMSGSLFASGIYAISGNTLILSGAYGSFNYAFQVSGNTLIVFDPVWGTTVTYAKTG